MTTQTTQQTPDPLVPAYAERRPSCWLLYIICPHCGDLHSHGGGTGPEPDYGNRLSHCIWHPTAGYTWSLASRKSQPDLPAVSCGAFRQRARWRRLSSEKGG